MDTFCSRTKILMGNQDLGKVLEGCSRVFVVTDSFMESSGRIRAITDSLARASMVCSVFSGVVPDPPLAIITEGVGEMLNFDPDAVIAFGGGSPIDAAKAILFFAAKASGRRVTPFVAIPTTSGTGSEVTSFAVVTDEDLKRKFPIIHDDLVPDIAILDAEFTASVPRDITADTGVDVLTHAIEAYSSINSTDFSDAVVEKCVRLVHIHLSEAYKNPSNLQARQGMHNASCLAGIGFNNASLGLNHGMAHALGGHFKIPHGRANAILLPYVMSFNAGCTDTMTPTAERYAALSRLIGMEAFSTRQSALNLIHWVRRYVREFRMPDTIAAARVSREAFDNALSEMSEAALADRCTATNPRACTLESVMAVFTRAYTGKLL